MAANAAAGRWEVRAVKVSETKSARLEDECGFCGASPSTVVVMGLHVRCFKCNARTPECPSVEDAIAVWNGWFAREPGAVPRLERAAQWKEEMEALRREMDTVEKLHAALRSAEVPRE